MLLSLISVLVLLVIAFFALWVGVVGRISSNEGPELSIPGRALVFVIAMVAFGVAYVVYQHPMDQSGVVVQSPAPAATPSSPPESRGQPVVESEEAISTEFVMAPEPEADEAEEPREPIRTTEAQRASSPGMATEAEEDALSPSAAALENRAQQPRVSAGRYEPDSPVTPVRANAAIAAEAPAAVGKGSELIGQAKRSRRYPLLLHVQNQLGPDQQREQLTLRIEGKTVARIAVDDENPQSSVAVPLPRPGLLHYRLEGFSEASGKTELLGHGCIKVRDGSRYAVRRAADGRRVFLEATRTAG